MADDGVKRGFWGTIGHAIHEFFKQRDISRTLDIIENNPKEVLGAVTESVKDVGKVADAATSVASGVATYEKADSDAYIAAQKALTVLPGSQFANNVRPAIALMFALLIVAQALGFIVLHLTPDQQSWLYTITGGYMGLWSGGKTMERITQIVHGAKTVRAIIDKSS